MVHRPGMLEKKHVLLQIKDEVHEFVFLEMKHWKGRTSSAESRKSYFLALAFWLSSRS